jgi:hypothetical protein
MRHGFAKALAEIARSRSGDNEVAVAGAGSRRRGAIEYQLRERSRMGDRVAFGLGFAVAVGAASFLIYAIEASDEFRKSGLEMPRIIMASSNNKEAGPVGRRTIVADPETTGALARDSMGVDGKSSGKAEEGGPEDFSRYTLKRAFQGFATLEGPAGIIDVVPGSDVPGAGKVTAIRQVAGQWVVETSAGVIRPSGG